MQAGERIKDHYIVEAELGRGSFGEVVRARHPELANLKYAIKLLHEEARRSPEFVELFFREARILSELDNPHVCRIQEFGYTGPERTPFLVMELLQGESLATQLERGALPPELAIEYMLQICEGLGEAHAHDVIHRDLKPANIFVTRVRKHPLLKVLDFGVAKGGSTMMVETLSNTTSGPGTILYMSPEQLLRPKDVMQTSDIWALGAILHELVIGTPPFAGETTTAVSVAILEGNYARVPDRARALQPVIDRCLRRHANERFASTTELAAALEQAKVALAARPKSDISSAPTVPRPPLDAVLDSTFKNSRGEMHATVSADRWRLPAFIAAGLALGTIVVLGLAFGGKHHGSTQSAKSVEVPHLDAAVAVSPIDATAVVVAPPDAAPPPAPAPVVTAHATHESPKSRPKVTSAPSVAPLATPLPPAQPPSQPPSAGSASHLPKINTELH